MGFKVPIDDVWVASLSTRWLATPRRRSTCDVITTSHMLTRRAQTAEIAVAFDAPCYFQGVAAPDPPPLHHTFREARGGAPSSRSRSRRRGAGVFAAARRRQVLTRRRPQGVRGLQAQQRPKPDEDGRERRHGAQDPGFDHHGGRAHSPGERVCVIPNASLRNDTLSHYHDRLRAM